MVTPIPTVVQQPGHTTQKADQYVGPQRQLTVDVTRQELRLQDGKTKGGWRFPNLRQLQQMFMTNKSEFGRTEFTADAKGILTRVSDRTYQVRQLLGLNGLKWSHSDGSDGNPTLELPDRLKESTPYVSTALDGVIETGFYFVAKNTANLPSDIAADDNILIVIGYNDTTIPFSLITQIALDASQAAGALYIRRRLANVWTPWSNLSGIKGVLADLNDGVDQQLRVWSAFELSQFIRSQVQTIQYIDNANVAKAFSINVLFSQAGAGADMQTVSAGPFNVATNDRFELLGSGTAPAGTTRTAKVEVEVAGVFQTVASQNISAPADSSLTDNVIGRLVKTAGGYDIVDANWATQSSLVGAATGNFRFTTGASEKAGARLTRWR